MHEKFASPTEPCIPTCCVCIHETVCKYYALGDDSEAFILARICKEYKEE